MASYNEELLDAMMRHQIGLLRYSGGLRNRIWELLDASESDLRARVALYAGRAGLETPQGVKNLGKLLAALRETRKGAWSNVRSTWFEEMRSLAQSEPLFLREVITSILPVEVTMKLPPPEVLREIVNSRPFEGKALKEWARKLEADDIAGMERQVKIGLSQGEHPNAIARRLVGRKRLAGRDGFTQVTRRNAAAVSRTVSAGIAAEGRRELLLANSDILTAELFVATLDSRTTPICQSYSGTQYKVGEGPRLPLHFGERSLYAPVIDGQVIGERPAKDYSEAQLVREYAQEKGLNPRLRRRKSLPKGHKGSFDAFKRARVRELTGTVPATTTYPDFLRRQSAAVQDDILGPTKGALFRRGGLSLDKFVEESGRELTLAELAARHEGAFLAANLNPSDFL